MNSKWTTTNDMPNLTGKIIIVTGANSGIGFEASKEFSRAGAQVILACRNMQKGESALAALQSHVPTAQAEIMQLDLASQKSIHAFADAFQAKYDQLDVLVNNAGIMQVPYGTTEDGFERQLGTNHLGHFTLTGLLINTIRATANARVVNISSIAHRAASINFDNLMYEGGTGYSPGRAYGRSKLANLMFTYELQRRFEAGGVNAIAVAAHPGVSNTNLNNHLTSGFMSKIMMRLTGRMMQSAAMGALPTMRAAVDPNVKGGDYYGPDGFMGMTGNPVKVKSSKASHNLADQQKLRQVSQELTGVTYL